MDTQGEIPLLLQSPDNNKKSEQTRLIEYRYKELFVQLLLDASPGEK